MSTHASDPAEPAAGTAMPADKADTAQIDPAALQADLEPRVARLEQLVAGFDQVLQRFAGADAGGGAGAAAGPAIFENFDDAGASNEALDLLFASSTDARRDLAALRRDVPTLLAADRSAGHWLMVRVRALGASAAGLAGRFEEYGRSISPTVPPRTTAGVGRLNEFVALVVRALLDIADVADGLRRHEDRLIVAPTSPPEEHRPAVAAVGLPVAGGPWRLLQRHRTRWMIAAAGVVVVGVAILVSQVSEHGSTPGSAVGSLAPSAGPERTAPPDVAIASGSPSPSASSPPATEPGASAAPTPNPSSAAPAPTPPRPTPRPTQRPAPTPRPPAAVTQFSNRTAAVAAVIDGLLDTITTAVQDTNLPMAASAAHEMGVTATRERSWLQAHPPLTCYRPIHESAMAAYDELIVTATGIVESAEAGDANAIHPQVASSRGDDATLRQAGSKAIAACT
jgi:hypothetical protein